jgi:acetyl-CoA acetyltransferase
MTSVHIIGIDMIPFGRYPNRTVASLGAEAALLALDDAGLRIKDMQALYCGNLMEAHLMVGQRILREIGQTGIAVVNTANACATGATAFREGVIAIQAGLYDLVLAVGVEQMGRGLLGGAKRADGFVEEGEIGSSTMPATFAQIGLEHTRLYGTTFEQFAKVAVKNHHHSTMNPKAMSRRETPIEEVMAAEMISYPNTKLMCSINVDGAAAAVATAELVHYENLGLCPPGEAGRLIDEGSTALGGRTPVNVSGGLLSKGHPLGATGIANLYEVATHLRGAAGSRQVAGARIGLTHVVGGTTDRGSACVIHILERS